jgi:hypothetical protein
MGDVHVHPSTRRGLTCCRPVIAGSEQKKGARLRQALGRARLRDRRTPLELRSPLGDAIETFIRREDAERFVGEVRGDDPELASYLRIEERGLEVGGLN